MQLYYITFCWNRELFYDGYFIKKEDNTIIGFTDDSIIAGDETVINEVCQENHIIQYDISAEDFYENDIYEGFSVRAQFDEATVMIKIRKDYKMTKERIESRINRTLKEFPQYIQSFIRENYFGVD